MSGFFGVVMARGERADQTLLNRAAEKLRLRGPDGSNIWVREEFAAAFSFLRTSPAKQAEQQPMVLDGRYHLLGDVRVDGQKELLARLAQEGEEDEPFVNHEDLLLRAWQHWGAECFEEVIGDFSFGLWDSSEKTLWCARDFVGLRPFFYAQASDGFYFSNTLSVLRLVPNLSLELDEIYLGDFLREGFCKTPVRTVYKNIRRLAPGHLLKLRNGIVEIRRFFKLPIEEPLYLDHPNEYLEMYRGHLRQAAGDRLPEGQAALYLSGGLDSSTVCAVASGIALERGEKERLKTFTVSWRPLWEDPEPEYAAMTARRLQLPQEILQDAEFVPYDDAGRAMAASPEPSNEVFLAGAIRSYMQIAKHSRVILGGEGGDDILTGQSWPFLKSLWKKQELSRMVQLYGKYILQHGKFPPLRGGFRVRLQGLRGGASQREQTLRWLNPEFEKKLHSAREDESRAEPLERHPVHPLAYAGLHSGYWGDVLEGDDAGCTGVNLEVRAPMLDLRLLRFLLRLPAVPWCANKELTRRAMRGYLPEAVLKRGKTPLLKDPLEVVLQKNVWRPGIRGKPPEGLEKYVSWAKWQETLLSPPGCIRSEDLRPLSLAYWLKGIENTRLIQ